MFVPGRGDSDESAGRQEGDGDDGRRVMEMDLVEGSVTTAAAAALSSAATKAKVKPTHWLKIQPITQI